MVKDKDYIADSERYESLMAIYRHLKRHQGALRELDSRAWKNVDVSAAKVLREARRLMKTLKTKRVRR